MKRLAPSPRASDLIRVVKASEITVATTDPLDDCPGRLGQSTGSSSAGGALAI